MNTYIVDASVAVKWYFEEEFKIQALSIARQIKLEQLSVVVPEIFYLEISSACWKRALKKEIKSWQAVEILEGLTNLPVRKYSDHELADVALDNALFYNISVYDSLYISLAEIYGAALITADKRLFNACKEKGFPWIEWLGELRL